MPNINENDPNATLRAPKSRRSPLVLMEEIKSDYETGRDSVHDKVTCVDNKHVQSGSFNYSGAAEKKNSENVLFIWKNPQLAATYLKHCERNWSRGTDYQPGY